MLDEFEMAVSQSEKLARKRKAGAKRFKCIRGIQNFTMFAIKCQKPHAAAKQKKKGKEPSEKVIEAQWYKWRRTRN